MNQLKSGHFDTFTRAYYPILLQIISIFFPSFISCTNNPKVPAVIAEQPRFMLDSSELSLLSDGSCDKIIDLDSLTLISQYHRIKNDIYMSRNKLDKKLCIRFKFLGDINDKPNMITLQHHLRPQISRSGGLIPSRLFLFVSIADSNSIYNIAGNIAYNPPPKTYDTLDYFVKRFFLNEVDTINFGQKFENRKFVNLFFPNDSLYYANKYLTQLVTGYISAQREICKQKYGKALKDATPKEMNELKKIRPLIFGIFRDKNHP